VLRDVLAAVRNLEELLRSPRVGPRALAPVIPGLKGFCAPLLIAVDQILAHVQEVADLPVDGAVLMLGQYVQEISERLRASLERASSAALDAKNRLCFESVITGVGAELDSVRQLLDLLVHAAEVSETDLDIEEVVQVAIGPPSRTDPRAKRVKVTASYTRDASGFRASPQVLMPLISAGIAMVARSSERVFLNAVCLQDEPIRIVISHDCPAPGAQYDFELPLVIAPTLVCVKTAAQLASGTFEAEPGRVAIVWPRNSST